MGKVKDVGVVLENATVDTPLPEVKSFRVSYQGKIFRCREYNNRGNKYFYLEKNHKYKKLTQFISKPEDLNAALIKQAAETILDLMQKREAEFEVEKETEKDLRTLVMELQAEVARLNKKVDALQAG